MGLWALILLIAAWALSLGLHFVVVDLLLLVVSIHGS